MEKAPCDQEKQVQQGNLKKALETIAFIMTGSIEEVGTRLNLDTEGNPIRTNSETNDDLNSQVSTEVDSDTVASSESGAFSDDLGFKTWMQ